MAEWEKRFLALNLIVGGLERSKAFYREVFGLAPLNKEEVLAIFRFTDTFVALRHDPAHQDASTDEVLGLAQKGVGQFAIVVEDVDAVCAELEEHGVTVISGPADRDWGMRTLTFDVRQYSGMSPGGAAGKSVCESTKQIGLSNGSLP